LNSEAPRARPNLVAPANPEAPPEPDANLILLAAEQELEITHDASFMSV